MKRTYPSRQRYIVGMRVYVRGWPLADAAMVTDVLESHQGWPFYELLAADASVWIVPRILCSTVPLTS
jgi:hypothetical protein